MRFVACILALLALVAGVQADNRYPLTDLKVIGLQTIDGSAISYSGSVIPSFANYHTNTLRYSAEYTASAPINFRVEWTASTLFSSPTQLKLRNCATYLATPTAASGYSYCSYITPTTLTDNGATNSFLLDHVSGSNMYELQTIGDINGVPTTISYVLLITVTDGQGNNMYVLDTDYTASFSAPYNFQQQQYTIAYTAQFPTGTAYRVNFYFATQKTVDTVFVQECPGVSCLSCDINQIFDRKVLAGTVPGGFTALPADQKEGVIAAAPGAKSGRYQFPAAVGDNCVRFINRIDAGVEGTNDFTITISLKVTNCGQYLNCYECTRDAACGWCLDDNQILRTGYGYCRVGKVDKALTGETCTVQAGLVVPRYILAEAGCTVIIKGDPRITGLQGQDFQVHGTPNEYFNLVSTESLQVNSRFVYLDEASCDNFTSCFSHPGTYIDEIGVMMGSDKVRVVAGSIKEATRVFINGKEVKVSAHKHTAGKISVKFAHTRRVVVKTPEFMMTISQSDKFFNVESALLKTELLDQGSKLLKIEGSRATEANTAMHGLIGQTWRNNIYAGNREYEGEVSDYQVADGLWGKDFAFNLYKN